MITTKEIQRIANFKLSERKFISAFRKYSARAFSPIYEGAEIESVPELPIPLRMIVAICAVVAAALTVVILVLKTKG